MAEHNINTCATAVAHPFHCIPTHAEALDPAQLSALHSAPAAGRPRRRVASLPRHRSARPQFSSFYSCNGIQLASKWLHTFKPLFLGTNSVASYFEGCSSLPAGVFGMHLGKNKLWDQYQQISEAPSIFRKVNKSPAESNSQDPPSGYWMTADRPAGIFYILGIGK